MRLSEAGELGLLRELESRGLIVGTEHDAAELADGLVVTQDALVEGVHFRLDWLSWRELGFRAAAVNLSDLSASARTAGGAVRDARRCRATSSWSAWSSSTRGSPRRACPCAAATRRAPAASWSASPRSAAPTASRAGPARGRATSSSSPARSARRLPRSGTGRYVRPPLRTEEGLRLGAVATRCSTSRTVSPSTRVTSPAAPAVAS